jgi:hypothetical protein
LEVSNYIHNHTQMYIIRFFIIPLICHYSWWIFIGADSIEPTASVGRRQRSQQLVRQSSQVDSFLVRAQIQSNSTLRHCNSLCQLAAEMCPNQPKHLWGWTLGSCLSLYNRILISAFC